MVSGSRGVHCCQLLYSDAASVATCCAALYSHLITSPAACGNLLNSAAASWVAISSAPLQPPVATCCTPLQPAGGAASILCFAIFSA